MGYHKGEIMKRATVLLMFGLLAGCATTAKYKAVLDTWIGAPAQKLVEAWGYPSSQMTAPDGNTVYIYQNNSSFVMPTVTTTNAAVSAYGNSAYGTATSLTTGGSTIDMSCTTYFEIGPDKTVVGYQAQGNGCVSR
jgi:hypothetical protein